jgi:hypothetical protein
MKHLAALKAENTRLLRVHAEANGGVPPQFNDTTSTARGSAANSVQSAPAYAGARERIINSRRRAELGLSQSRDPNLGGGRGRGNGVAMSGNQPARIGSASAQEQRARRLRMQALYSDDATSGLRGGGRSRDVPDSEHDDTTSPTFASPAGAGSRPYHAAPQQPNSLLYDGAGIFDASLSRPDSRGAGAAFAPTRAQHSMLSRSVVPQLSHAARQQLEADHLHRDVATHQIGGGRQAVRGVPRGDAGRSVAALAAGGPIGYPVPPDGPDALRGSRGGGGGGGGGGIPRSFDVGAPLRIPELMSAVPAPTAVGLRGPRMVPPHVAMGPVGVSADADYYPVQRAPPNAAMLSTSASTHGPLDLGVPPTPEAQALLLQRQRQEIEALIEAHQQQQGRFVAAVNAARSGAGNAAVDYPGSHLAPPLAAHMFAASPLSIASHPSPLMPPSDVHSTPAAFLAVDRRSARGPPEAHTACQRRNRWRVRRLRRSSAATWMRWPRCAATRASTRPARRKCRCSRHHGDRGRPATADGRAATTDAPRSTYRRPTAMAPRHRPLRWISRAAGPRTLGRCYNGREVSSRTSRR